ncbi:MAG: outer membrane protein [Acidobacteriota bacterium]|nr:outer membrane protein [Acidobacteriota bacterium]
MFSPDLKRSFLLAVALSTVLSTSLPAQQPAATPQTPAQRDATRPPGTEQRTTLPENANPRPVDPTRPPGADTHTAPQAAPGTQLPPSNLTTQPQINQQQPAMAATPSTDPNAEPQEPNLPAVEARPVPPLPSLARLGVQSGNTLALSMNEAIKRALANNNDIEVARDTVRYNETVLRSLEGVFDPVFTYTPEVNNFVRPITSIFGGATSSGTVAITDLNNNFEVNKQFGTGGGNYQYFFNNTRESSTATSATLTPFYSANQGITFTQPLLRNRSVDRNRQSIRIQRKRLEQTDADFRRSTIDVISRVQRAYWDLVFSLRDQENQVANVNLARENFRRTEASVAAGASAPLQRAEVQTELANREQALLNSVRSVSISENNLKQLILRDPLAPEWTASLVPTDQPSFDERPINLEDSLNEARKNRPELQRLKLENEVTDINLDYFKNQTKPLVNVNATLSTTGLAGTPSPTFVGGTSTFPLINPALSDVNASAFLLAQINALRAQSGLAPVTSPNITSTNPTVPSQFVGGYGQTLKNLFGFSTRNIVVGVTVQLPFRNRTAQANLAGERILKEQLQASIRSQDQEIEVEVRNAAQAVETARLVVLAARDAERNAEVQLQGEQRLYQVGRSTTFLLFQRENTLVNARNQELRAETDYNKALADLQRATSTTLRANNVIVESPLGQ